MARESSSGGGGYGINPSAAAGLSGGGGSAGRNSALTPRARAYMAQKQPGESYSDYLDAGSYGGFYGTGGEVFEQQSPYARFLWGPTVPLWGGAPEQLLSGMWR